MRTLSVAFAVILFSVCMCLAQQSPPADGVGLGNDHLSPNGSDSNVPSMSPDQNSVMTDTNGSVTGDKGVPAFAGAPPASDATRVNSQGTASVSGSASSTASRSEAYPRNGTPSGGHTAQKQQNGAQPSTQGSNSPVPY
jgi:hypothetical protein